MAKNKKQELFVDKVYKLSRNVAPLSYMLASKNSKRKPLLYFDESEGINNL